MYEWTRELWLFEEICSQVIKVDPGRKERICVPEILRRPRLADLLASLAHLAVVSPTPVNPNPPDPAALVQLLRERPDLATVAGPGIAARWRLCRRSEWAPLLWR